MKHESGADKTGAHLLNDVWELVRTVLQVVGQDGAVDSGQCLVPREHYSEGGEVSLQAGGTFLLILDRIQR